MKRRVLLMPAWTTCFLSELLLLGAVILLAVKGAQAEPPKDPIYMKTSNGWNAAYAHDNEYAEFRIIGNSAKLQDAYHILLQKGCWNDGFLCR